MTLSKRGDYVVRSALSLAKAWPGGGQRKIREVVAEMGVPQTFASQILADLVRAGLATSKAGKDGGYRLSRPPADISLVEVVEAGEGPLHAERCALGEGPCRWDAVCPLHETWRSATEALRNVLGSTTLADLAAQDALLEDGEVPLPADSHRAGGSVVEVDDWAYVEAGIEAVEQCVQHEERVVRAIERAYEEAEAVRGTVQPEGVPWWPVQVSATCGPASPPAGPAGPAADDAATGKGPGPGARAEGGTDAVIGYSLSWEAVGAGSVGSHADVRLVARAEDEARTELRLAGRFRPPHPGRGPLPDPAATERLIRVAMRSLLRQLARSVEEPPAQLARSARRPT